MVFAKDASGPVHYFKRLRSRFSDLSSRPQKKPFIVPTSFGLVFGCIALILLIFALGYANNTLYIFVFLVISFAITSMYVANRNLEFVSFKNAFCADLFANQNNSVKLTLENTTNETRYDFSISVAQNKENTTIHLPKISAFSEEVVQLEWFPLKRGWQILPRFQIETTYPFGMLRAWRNYQSTDRLLVFPEKRGEPFFRNSENASRDLGSQGLFRDHREYSIGDQVRRIDWRASSKHQELLIKNFENQESRSFEFSWQDTQFINDYESRISQLALWIDICESQNFQYSLQIDRKKTAVDKGLQHYRQCLKILAEMPEVNQ